MVFVGLAALDPAGHGRSGRLGQIIDDSCFHCATNVVLVHYILYFQPQKIVKMKNSNLAYNCHLRGKNQIVRSIETGRSTNVLRF